MTALRSFLVLLPLAWGCYLMTMLRTSGFGPDDSSFLGPLAIVFLYVGLPAALPFLGLSWRKVVAGVMGVCLASIAVAEAFGRAQEMHVVRVHGATPEKNLTIRRWWPFEHHDIYFIQGKGWSGCD